MRVHPGSDEICVSKKAEAAALIPQRTTTEGHQERALAVQSPWLMGPDPADGDRTDGEPPGAQAPSPTRGRRGLADNTLSACSLGKSNAVASQGVIELGGLCENAHKIVLVSFCKPPNVRYLADFGIAFNPTTSLKASAF